MVVGSFGNKLVFEVSDKLVFTPRGVKRDIKARYEEHQVLGAKPRLEFIAPELLTVSFPITLSAFHGLNPAARLTRINECIEGGIAEMLILGGLRMGYHVITESSEEWRHALPDGQLISVELNLTLKEYIK